MKSLKKALCLLLVAAMLSGLCVSFADSAKDYSGYRKYVSLGDSIANGIGENNVENKYMYRTPGAYPDRIANAIGAELKQLGCGGMRSVELRACLEDDYRMPDEFANNFSRSVVDNIRGYYVPAIKDADIITLNIGANDMATYTLLRAKAAANDLGVSGKLIDNAIASLEAKGEYTAALIKLLDLVKTVDKYGNIVKAAIDGLSEGYSRFIKNWDAIIGDIYALNPDVTLLVAGFYNPFDHLKISDNSLLELGKAFDGIIEALNTQMRYGSKYAGKYIYVDIMGAESIAAKYGDSLTDEGFFSAVELDVHPSNEGQAFIAQRIIDKIPSKAGAPFRDISTKPLIFRNAIDWAYDKGIVSGKTADRFCPDDNCTRAQIITMLWRAAGSPAPKRNVCPFTDVSSSAYYYKAVAWGTEKGIISGYTATQFAPDDICTRGQIVSFLYRYAGSPYVLGSLAFSDVSRSSYCYNAVKWAVKNDICSGYDSKHFAPDDACTRAQAVCFIYRYMT